MVKKFFIFFILIFLQSSHSYSREFSYDVYGLNINFVNLKLNISEKKIYSKIDSKGLIGYFFSFKNIIQTTYDNKIIEYYFNLKKKGKEKNYQFKSINGLIDFKNVKLNKGKNFKLIKRVDFKDAIDPLTALNKIFYSNKINSKCNLNEKIYDGDDIYEVFLKPINQKKSEVKFKENKYEIRFVCRLNYKAISGHKIKREKKLNSMYLDVYFSNIQDGVFPVYFETKTKIIPLKMYLSTVLNP